jgi:hypothetical protein
VGQGQVGGIDIVRVDIEGIAWRNCGTGRGGGYRYC